MSACNLMKQDDEVRCVMLSAFCRAVAAAMFLSALTLGAGATSQTHGHSQPQTKTQPLPKRSDTQVYLMRGLFGVFSLGIDELAAKLKAGGYQAAVFSWDSWPQVAKAAAESYGTNSEAAIVVIGHSLGANSVFSVADALNGQSIPIDMAVTFDATAPGEVPPNVVVFFNFWASDGFGHPVTASPGYTGDLENFDLSGKPGIDHTSIDATDSFHQFVINRLESMTSE